MELLERPIGIFDSGLGGLTVLQPMLNCLPQESTIYLGDTARTPYGDRTIKEIQRFALEGLEFFIEKGVKALVVACNSASAVALPEIIAQAPFPVYDVVSPGAQVAARCTRSCAVGVIGTQATVESEAYVLELKSNNINLSIHQVACPKLVPLIEEGMAGLERLVTVVRDSIEPLPLHDIDTLILGCTHYPLIKDVIAAVTGDDMRLIDSGRATAEYMAKDMTDRTLRRRSSENGSREYYITSNGREDINELFRKKAERFLGEPISKVLTANIAAPAEAHARQRA